MDSDLIKGKTAKFYNIGAYLSGLVFVYKKTLSLIDLKNGESLLDVGCGTAVVLRKLRKKFSQSVKLYGIDPSPEMLQVAKSRIAPDEISLKIAYANDLPFVNNSLDWVISTLAFHHMPSDEKRKAIGEMARVLKPDGKILISDFGRPKGLFGKIFAWISKGHSYTKGNMDLVEQVLEQNGFRVVKVGRTLGWIEHLLCQKM